MYVVMVACLAAFSFEAIASANLRATTLLVATVSAVLALVAWPWGRAQNVLVIRDGTVLAQKRG